MCSRIVQVDLAHPLPALRGGQRGAMLRILVRLGAMPLGWVELPADRYGESIAPDLLGGLIADALWPEIHDAARSRAFEPIALAAAASFSIVLCAGADLQGLERQLRSIERLEYADREVIVVDRSGDDRLAAVCRRFGFIRRVIEPRPGLSRACNSGLLAARGQIVAFLGEGCCVDSQWMTALAANYADPRIHGVFGPALPTELATAAQEQSEADSALGFVRREYGSRAWSTFLPLHGAMLAAGANLSIRREPLIALRGFDVALGAGSRARGGAELDLIARVLAGGGRIAYEPRAICWREHRRAMKDLAQRRFDLACGLVACCMKHRRDAELGQHARRLLQRWVEERLLWRRTRRRTQADRRARWCGSIALALTDLAGGLRGLRIYRESVRAARRQGREPGLIHSIPASTTSAGAAPTSTNEPGTGDSSAAVAAASTAATSTTGAATARAA